MTEKKPSASLPDKNRLSEVMLALALEQEQPAGNKPTLVEISVWRTGMVGGQRAAEIKSHVARDPDCYRMWSDLIAAERQLSAEKSLRKSAIGKRLKGWFPGWRLGLVGGGAALAIASIFVAVIGLRIVLEADVLASIDQDLEQWSTETPPTVSGWGQGLMSKGFDLWGTPTPLAMAKTAISVGIRKSLEQLSRQGVIPDTEAWKQIIETYTSKLTPCPEGETMTSCQEQNELLTTLGRWTALMAFDCRASVAQPTSDYWILQKKRLDEFAQAVATYPGLEEIQEMIRQWPVPPTSGAADFCGQVENFKAFVARK